MLRRIMFSMLVLPLWSVSGWAQHADIEFSYENDVLIIRDGIPSNNEGAQIFEATFPLRGFTERFTENPGFLSEIGNGDMVLPGDDIELELFESQTFGSFLTYFDPATGQMEPTAATIRINDNAGTNTEDLEISNTDFSGVNPQFIQTGSSAGEIHSHIDFFLSEEAEGNNGAYGILFRLTTSNSMIENSQLIWLVFNFGMSPSEFDELAVPAFAAGGSLILGDVNGDGVVDLLDVAPFADLLTNNGFLPEADINMDGVVDLLDVGPFVGILTG